MTKNFSIVKYLDRIASIFFLMSWIFSSATVPAIVLASIAVIVFITWLVLVIILVKEKPSKLYGILAALIFLVCIAFTIFIIIYRR